MSSLWQTRVPLKPDMWSAADSDTRSRSKPTRTADAGLRFLPHFDLICPVHHYQSPHGLVVHQREIRFVFLSEVKTEDGVESVEDTPQIANILSCRSFWWQLG